VGAVAGPAHARASVSVRGHDVMQAGLSWLNGWAGKEVFSLIHFLLNFSICVFFFFIPTKPKKLSYAYKPIVTTWVFQWGPLKVFQGFN
jgi:hypothetical protein